MKKKSMILFACGMTAAFLSACSESQNETPVNAPKEVIAESESAPASTDPAPLNLIIAANQTSEDNPYSIGMDTFKEVIEDISDGKITVTEHKGTLGENESDLVVKLEMGAADIIVTSPAFMTAFDVPEVEMFSLEYLFDSFEHWERCIDGEFGARMKSKILEKTNNDFRILSYWSSSVRNIYGSHPVQKPEDLNGMVIRIQDSSVQEEFFRSCGAEPTSVSWDKLYQAFKDQEVDAAENDYTNLMQKNHHTTENGMYISETKHDYTTRLLLMDGNRYDSLTDEQKNWINEAAAAATEKERSVTYDMIEKSKEKVLADGAKITEYNDIDLDAFYSIAQPIQDQFAAEYDMQEELDMIRSAK